ncbi:MAG: PD-(D/E)XK nuclease family protein, partial [Bacteroidaceae bacterium]|nr:PD-(D/E)XK nuclease family protein [Bacteroidaceae bacterium]
MNAFLTYVADDILTTFGTNLQDLVVVFPNKRANLFLNEYLAKESDQPLWAPKYMSISELFRSFSDKQVGDHILLVCMLYQSYLQVTGKNESDESLDQFFGWGEILLADFDDVDKNLVDAHQLFRNLKELKELDADTRSYL